MAVGSGAPSALNVFKRIPRARRLALGYKYAAATRLGLVPRPREAVLDEFRGFPPITSHFSLAFYPSQPRNPSSPAVATTINGLTLVKMKTAAQTAVRR